MLRQLIWLWILMSACVLRITKLHPIDIQDISFNKQGLQIPAQCRCNLVPWKEDPLRKTKKKKGLIKG